MQPFENIFQDSVFDAPKWVLIEKERAWKEFCKSGIPTRKEEDWKYTNLSFLNKTKYQKLNEVSSLDLTKISQYLIPETLTIVYWNGILADVFNTLEDLPTGLQVMPLASAFLDKEKDLSELFQKFSKLSKRNSLVLLNEAIASNGLFIKVGKNSQINKPIHILHLTSHQSINPIACFTRNAIIVENEASVKVYESHYCLDDSQSDEFKPFANKTCDVLLKRNANFTYICTQNLSNACDQISHTRVIQEEHSHLESNVLGVGGRLSRQSLEIWQTGQAAHSSLNGLFLGRGKQQSEQRTSIRHMVPHGTSDQYYKGVLTGNARGVFLGHVGVEKDAQKVAAKQLNKNLLLSDKVEIDTKPELEIDSDDVKCAHGATVSQLRSDEIFYLQSRGINYNKAKTLLSHAFAFEIIAKIQDQNIAQCWNQMVENFFEEAETQGDNA